MKKTVKQSYQMTMARDMIMHSHSLMIFALNGLERGLCGPEGETEDWQRDHGARNQILVGICLETALKISWGVSVIWANKDKKVKQYISDIEKGCDKAYALADKMGYNIKRKKIEGF